MVDGIDGSGKGTIINIIKDFFEERGLKVFDLRNYEKEKQDFPEIEEIEEYDVIASVEPSYCLIGKAIRDEIVKNNGRTYSGLTTSYAFALDREILYKKVLLPALKMGKIIIQERGIITSLVYQPIQLERITLHQIMNIPGNKLALKNAPDLLLITDVKPEVVMVRLKEREKQDRAIFENLLFQKKISERYKAEWLKRLFEKMGSKVVYVNTEGTIEETKAKVLDIINKFIPQF